MVNDETVKLEELRKLLAELDVIDDASASSTFARLFPRGCELLGLDDKEAARVFDVSLPIVARWRSGGAAPPSAATVLRFLREEVGERIEKLDG